MTPNDQEHAAAVSILAGCQRWIEAQQQRQPHAWPAINAAIGAAAELRIEVTITLGSRVANVRAVTLDGQGTERMLLAAVNLQPNGPAGGH